MPSTSEDLDIHLTAAARQNLENMQKRVWDIANAYGYNSEEYQKALISFQQSLMQLLRFGGTIWAEDDLNLMVNSYITLGIIFHRKRIKNEDGSTDADPLLGEWSVHS